MKKTLVFLAFALLIDLNSFAQGVVGFDDVQWACKIVDGSQKYKVDDYSPVRALGKPDAYTFRPYASSNCFLFGYREKEDDETSDEAFLTVEFCTP